MQLEELVNPGGKHKRQAQFLRDIYLHKYVLYGGARGGGKSYILRWGLIHFLFSCTSRDLRHVRVALFSETYDETWKRQVTPLIKEQAEWGRKHGFGKEWLGKYNALHKEFQLHERWGGHVICFCNIDDPSSYQSAEFAAVAVDEITLLPDVFGVFDYLVGSLRWKGLDWCPFFAATNPTGPGHSQVKRMWVEQDFTDQRIRNRNPADFRFIRSLPTDNPYLSKQYIEENLEGMPEHLRLPWLDGSWDIVAGQRFDKFRRDVHVCKPFDLKELGPVTYHRSIDYGHVDPMCCGWYGIVKTHEKKWPKDPGFRCWKVKEHLETGLNTVQQAQRVFDMTRDMKIKIGLTWLDTQAWGEYELGLSMADRFQQILGECQQAIKDKIPGWEAMALLMDWEGTILPGEAPDLTKDPILRFFDTCPATINQIQDAMWDAKKGYDILETRKGGGHQDALHETRYFCLSHLHPPSQEEGPSWIDEQKAIWKAMQTGKKHRGGNRLRKGTGPMLTPPPLR